MGLKDKLLEFSLAQAIIADALSTDWIDRETANDDIVAGEKMVLELNIIQVFNTLTSMTITLESDSTADMATAATVHATRSLTLAQLAAGKKYYVGIASGAPTQRFLRVRYNVVGTDPTTGTVTARLIPVSAMDENPPV